jgi:hypothetical protein
MSLPAKIIGVFLDPRRTFSSLDHKPDFILPLLIVMVAAFLFTFIIWPIAQQFSLEKMEQSGLSIEQIERAMKYARIAGIVSQPLMVLISSLLIAAVLLFAGNIIMGAEANYKRTLSVYCYSSLIGVIGFALKSLLILKKNSLEVYISPAALFPITLKDTVFFKIAAIFDVFAIWQVIIIAIGMSAIFKAKFQKALTVVGVLYLLYAAVAIFSGLGQKYGG